MCVWKDMLVYHGEVKWPGGGMVLPIPGTAILFGCLAATDGPPPIPETEEYSNYCNITMKSYLKLSQITNYRLDCFLKDPRSLQKKNLWKCCAVHVHCVGIQKLLICNSIDVTPANVRYTYVINIRSGLSMTALCVYPYLTLGGRVTKETFRFYSRFVELREAETFSRKFSQTRMFLWLFYEQQNCDRCPVSRVNEPKKTVAHTAHSHAARPKPISDLITTVLSACTCTLHMYRTQ